MQLSLRCDPAWPWPAVVLASLIMLATVVWMYREQAARLPLGTRRVLLGLRLVTWAALVFALCGPVFEWSESDRRSSSFVMLCDSSRSMSVTDGPGGVSRRAALVQAWNAVADEREALGREVDLRTYDFDKGLAPFREIEGSTTGEQSAIGQALDEAVRDAHGRRIVHLLLMTDGAQRALPPYDLDARVAARRLADLQIPVHTVGFGATGFSESAVDLIVEELDVNPTVFEKNTVVVSSKLRALGAADRDLTVRLWIEDPLASRPGEPPVMRIATPPLTVRASSSQELIPVEMSFVAQHAGEFKLMLEVAPLENEPLRTNNSLATYITVLKGGVSVAYFDVVRPEQKFIRRVNESPDIRLDFKPVRNGKDAAANRLDPDWFQPGKYDVYIVGDVPAKAFGPELLRKLARAVEQGSGLMMLGGFHSFGAGGYANSPLADLLPNVMRSTETQPPGRIDPTQQLIEPLQMLPTAAGLHDFVMRLDVPSRNLERWKSLSPLQGANRFSGLKPLARVLAEAPDKSPLLISLEVGHTRTMAFGGDTTYQWALAGQLEAHQRFWQQAILWLAHKDVEGDNSIWVKLNSRRFRPGQPVALLYGARDTEKRPIEDAQFRVEVSGPGGKKEPLLTVKAGTENTAKFVNTQQPGEYRVTVDATRNGQSLGLGAQARFVVYEQDLELHNPAADLALLEELSRITGGEHVRPEQLGDLLKRLKKQGLNVEIQKITSQTLWDTWPLLLVVVTSLSAEWTVRKWRGLV